MKKRSQNAKSKIIKTVLKMLSQGNSHFSMSEIAASSGVSKSSLYYFFENKKHLFEEIIFAIFGTLGERVETISQKSISPEKKMLQMMKACTQCAEKDGAVTHFIFQQVFEHDQKILGKIHDMRESLKLSFANVIREGIQTGIFRKQNIDICAEIMVGYLDFIALRSAFRAHKIAKTYSSEKLCKNFISLLQDKK